ncbi:hypothetical protein D9758_015589 [Tetrapyrgos nigripes]|uniref:Aquaporin-like protein n=1 Tax=Tetrapyrgos nigripes TaxID=182062 RepID=A0A8H5FK79_9AGAR|nr:hypothetical protein D9758_015589 [Tetrapyrgos nigripes]
MTDSPIRSLSSNEKHSVGHDDQPSPPALTYLQPPKWWRYRQALRPYAAEFAGVMILIIFGDGVVCQVVLSANSGVASTPKGEYLSISFGWAVGEYYLFLSATLLKASLGVAMGLWVSVGISGGHLNPAVTLALATFRGFPWKKVPGYILAQLMGGLVGGGIIYANYIHAIDIVEGGRGIRTLKTAGLFSTYAVRSTLVLLLTPPLNPESIIYDVQLYLVGLHDQRLLLLLRVYGICSPPYRRLGRNRQKERRASHLLATTCALLPHSGYRGVPWNGDWCDSTFSWGGQMIDFELHFSHPGYAINPARDLGPRLLTSMVGYGSQVYTFRNQYWLWCPIMGSIIGCQAGAFLYDLLLYNGPGGLFSKWYAADETMV